MVHLRAAPQMHHELWKALHRVARGEAPGSPELREALFRRRLAEWVPGESGVRLTARGKDELLRER